MKLPEHILITNDDGIDAPGIRLLQQVIEAAGAKPVLVAPMDAQSGCSHHINLYSPFKVEQRAEREHAVDGSPADCVRVALHTFAPKTQLVLSGINAGGNMGHDVYLSGTVAAAREAAFYGIPAVALSQYISPERHLDCDALARRTEQVLAALLERATLDRAFWNVNFPDISPSLPDPEVVWCERCRSALPNQYRVTEAGFHYERGHYHARDFDPQSDVATCLGGRIAITTIPL
jgi:5'-nucleotidase